VITQISIISKGLLQLFGYNEFFHTDLNGAPEELTTANSDIVWECSFQLWGKRIHEIEHEPIEQNLRYQGQYLDRETGLHYDKFRYYDPDIGRFTQPDPIGLLGGFNLYQYAPNGLTWVDPLGLSCITSSNLYASGNKTKPRDPRIDGHNLKSGQKPDLYLDKDGLVIPNQGGTSTFKTPEQLPLTGNYHKLPEGTVLPDGIAIKYDGSDVGGKMSPGHATIYPTKAMAPENFIELFTSLPWEYAGKK
jgi:RHS repeat-associated protein